jgi:hypothetical protein
MREHAADPDEAIAAAKWEKLFDESIDDLKRVRTKREVAGARG